MISTQKKNTQQRSHYESQTHRHRGNLDRADVGRPDSSIGKEAVLCKVISERGGGGERERRGEKGKRETQSGNPALKISHPPPQSHLPLSKQNGALIIGEEAFDKPREAGGHGKEVACCCRCGGGGGGQRV